MSCASLETLLSSAGLSGAFAQQRSPPRPRRRPALPLHAQQPRLLRLAADRRRHHRRRHLGPRPVLEFRALEQLPAQDRVVVTRITARLGMTITGSSLEQILQEANNETPLVLGLLEAGSRNPTCVPPPADVRPLHFLF